MRILIDMKNTDIIIKAVKEFDNPYPKDIFRWDNKEKLDFNRGRFNKHCFEIVENVREHILKIIYEMIGDMENDRRR